jgi:hypothetical protein
VLFLLVAHIKITFKFRNHFRAHYFTSPQSRPIFDRAQLCQYWEFGDAPMCKPPPIELNKPVEPSGKRNNLFLKGLPTPLQISFLTIDLLKRYKNDLSGRISILGILARPPQKSNFGPTASPCFSHHKKRRG